VIQFYRSTFRSNVHQALVEVPEHVAPSPFEEHLQKPVAVPPHVSNDLDAGMGPLARPEHGFVPANDSPTSGFRREEIAGVLFGLREGGAVPLVLRQPSVMR